MKLEKVVVASKKDLDEVVPEVKEWRKEARDALEEYKIDVWREWAPEWLVPSLFVKELQVMQGEEMKKMQEGLEIMKDRVRIEEKYRKLQDKEVRSTGGRDETGVGEI